MRKIIATMLAAVTVMGSLASASVSPAEARQRFIPRAGGGAHAFHGFGGHHGFAGRQGFVGHRGGWAHRGWGGRRYYGGGYRGYGRYGYGGYGYDDYDDGGGAVAAGIFGLAAGAMLGSALSHHHSYGGSCAARFRTYNRATRTYIGNDGRPHRCG